MKKAKQVWTPEETAIVKKIISQFKGSPSAAFEKHPDWKPALEANHTSGAIYAKIHNVKNSGGIPRRVVIKSETSPEAAMAAPKGGRFVVVTDGLLQAMTCPNCQHSFNVLNVP